MSEIQAKYPQVPYHYLRGKDGCDECFDIIAGDGETVIASLPFWEDDDGRTEAMARLFAAAEERAEILESLVSQIGELNGESSVIDEDLMQGEAYKQAATLLAVLKPHQNTPKQPRRFVITWCLEDVQQIRPDLDEAEAGAVLEALEKHENSYHGVTWDTLESVAEFLFPRPEEE